MNRLLSALSLVLATPLAAQGLLIGPDPGPRPAPDARPAPRAGHGVHIARTQVRADIVDGVATTTIDQVLKNEGARDAEGTWFLPLPASAVADAFTMTVGGKEISGEVLDAGQARSVYESIVRRRRDPGLLEYAGDGMLRARIFPIPARGEVGVTVRLRQVLEPPGGVFEWSWPLRVARLGDAAAGPVGLEVHIRSRTALSTVVTPHGGAAVTRKGQHEATVSLEGQNADFEDLRVLYGLTEQEFGLHLLTYRAAGDPGYFTMLLSPPRTLDEGKTPPRCVQFVVDTSGSMKGDKIQQAKASLRTFLRSLRRQDRFQIVTFSSSVQSFFDAPRAATPEHVEEALARIDSLHAMGGTNIGDALQFALESVPASDDGEPLLPQIVFVTDGQPTVGLTEPARILELTKQVDKAETRVFALGVGDEIDVRLLDDLVQQHRGARDFVGSKEKLEVKVDALCQKISRPALTDVVVKCDGLDAFDVHPTRTRDLFVGEMLQVVGRYRDSGRHTVRVRGVQNGVVREFAFDVDFPATSARHSFVQTLWARQHVSSLLDAIRRNGQKPELVGEVKDLATRYGIVTPFTSQLIVEEGMRLAGVQPETRRRGGLYRGPGDTAPSPGGGGGAFNPGPSAGGPSGPATGGPSGPASPGPRREFDRLGRERTGRAAIEESKVLSGSDEFFLGSTRAAKAKKEQADREQPLLRRAAGRVFVPAGDDLVEQGLPDDWRERAVVVEAFSKDYFALLKAKPELREILALGERVVFRDGERIVHVRPAATEEPSKQPPKPAGGGDGAKDPGKK